jgi:FlaA1/EpsC-like NDP-sugar epimerase
MDDLWRQLRSPVTAFAHDVLAIPIAWLLAYWMRFNLGTIPVEYIHAAFRLLPIVIVVQAAVFWVFGLYRGVWRFASIPDFESRVR